MIENKGNTCFLGTALECIIHTPSMNNYIMTYNHQTKNEAILYYKLHTSVRNGEVGDPSELYKKIRSFYKPFDNRGQHDAHEAILVILEYLNIFMDRIPNTMYKGSLDGNRSWGERYSIVDEIYKLQFENRIRCTRCRYEILKYECTYGIYDTFTGIGSHALPGYTCDRCHERDTCYEHLSVCHYPPTLIVRLKNDCPLSIFEKVIVFGSRLYSLFAACLYIPGSKDKGHYNTVILKNEQWTLVDDDIDYPVRDLDTVRIRASVLFLHTKSRVEQTTATLAGLDDFNDLFGRR
jgi:ubiquitin C-terminal hydrolase